MAKATLPGAECTAVGCIGNEIGISNGAYATIAFQTAGRQVKHIERARKGFAKDGHGKQAE